MSGFKYDVLSILRDNVMLHGEATGLIIGGEPDLYQELVDRKLPVADRMVKPVLRFDYIVIGRDMLVVAAVLFALSLVSKQGLIIMDVSDWEDSLLRVYKSIFGDFTVTPLIYEDRKYLVVHSGVDYGN